MYLYVCGLYLGIPVHVVCRCVCVCYIPVCVCIPVCFMGHSWDSCTDNGDKTGPVSITVGR